MRTFFFLLLSLIMVQVNMAQDAKKNLKTASKNVSKYFLAPADNQGLLDEAMAGLDEAFMDAEIKADPEAWNLKGQTYNEISRSEIQMKIDNPSYNILKPEASLGALMSFNKAIELSTKKYHTKDALTGISECEENLNNTGIFLFQDQNYNDAFQYFEASIKAHDILVSNKEKSRLDDPTLYHEQIFYTGVCGYFGDNNALALPYFEKLFKKGNAQPLVYVGLFNLNIDNNETKAYEYLDAGKKLYPDDNEILFAEINYFIKVNKLDKLVEKLKKAIEKEPDNISVYNALGNVYDQLNQNERNVENIQKADEYFDLAFQTYGKVLEKEPNNFDAMYSQGALYYNKAASMVTKLNELSNDFSSAGTKKYNLLKTEMDGYFTQALPFFIKAESINNKDLSVLIALKEIYARQGDLEKSNAYKIRIEDLEK
ncbi:MAG: tetratricopeptide repeat protein [Saprospiraceae bacterium]